jgi:heme-degrading monooxygenase HmoA
MIARIWHGIVPKQRSAEYLELMRTRALPDYRRVPGNEGAHVLVRDDGDVVHFETLSFWASMAAIAAFAGPDVTAARYYDFDADFLLHLEPTVTHHEVYTD